MKNTKQDLQQTLIGKHVIVKRNKFVLKFEIENVNGFMFEGTIDHISGDSKFKVGEKYSVTDSELKYHSVVS